MALEGTPSGCFREETEALLHKLEDELDGAKLVWIKFHVSDVVNQKTIIDDVMADGCCLYSVIGQAPTNGSRVSLEDYALSGVHGGCAKENIASARAMEKGGMVQYGTEENGDPLFHFPG